METVNVKVDEQFQDREFYRESPLKTDKIAFSLYNFKPWQALPMQRNPGSDTIMYFVDGEAFMLINDAVFSVSPGDAMYVPAGATYGVLAGENDLNVVTVQGPKPVEVQQERGLFFRCPDCELEAPLTTGTETGDFNMCPRCETMVKLTKGQDSYRAEKTTETPPPEPELSHMSGEASAGEERKEPEAKLEFSVIDFQPWQALSMHKNPGSDTLLYVVQGQGIMFVDDEEKSVDANEAIYVPAGSAYGIMAADNPMTVMSIQGPVPVESEEVGGLEYECPVCSLETPVTTNTYDGCITVCPRCNVKLRLTRAGDTFKAEETTEQAPTEAEAQ
ncbi:cupin domain-containing protein [Methanocella arvoryzae]|nr:cupin domain-containing protein [Methanocella arvoryzae]